jgi:hypothetical protein
LTDCKTGKKQGQERGITGDMSKGEAGEATEEPKKDEPENRNKTTIMKIRLAEQ